jgi:UPF0042 nucleotide-binding protein
MKLLIVSGLSGSGKSTVLSTLEDCGYYCIDNLPISLLENFVSKIMPLEQQTYAKAAIGIDARNSAENLSNFADTLAAIRLQGIDCEVIYMQAQEAVLLQRYSETRRKHPLTTLNLPLTEAIHIEKTMLRSLAKNANILIDTSRTRTSQLKELIKNQIGERNKQHLSLQFQSFGFKHGIPLDADFVFDARALPNPYWIPYLRPLTGKDAPVIEFLRHETYAEELFSDIAHFIQRWIPRFEAENRSYLTIAVGCTGGQHRSVYLVETLAKHFQKTQLHIIIRHRELI